MCERIPEDVPPPFDIVKARERYKVNYNESMNTVLTQEMERYNELIETIRGSLSSLMNAIEGLILMTADLEATSRSMLDGKIPPLWVSGEDYYLAREVISITQAIRRLCEGFEVKISVLYRVV